MELAIAPDTAPQVVLTSPLTGESLWGGQLIVVAANAADVTGISEVALFVKVAGASEATLLSVDSTSPYRTAWRIPTNLVGERISFYAVARDRTGDESQSGASTFVVGKDTQPPAVSITSPAAGSTITTSQKLVLGAAAFDNTAVTSIEFLGLSSSDQWQRLHYSEQLVNQRAGGASITLNHVLTEDVIATVLFPGENLDTIDRLLRLKAVAKDIAGNQRESAVVEVRYTADQLPQINGISTVSGEACIQGQRCVITVDAEDDLAVRDISITIESAGAAILSATDGRAPFQFNFDVPVSTVANYDVTVVAHDSAGQEVQSTFPLVVVTDAEPPTIGFISPLAGVVALAGESISVVVGATDNAAIDRVVLRWSGNERIAGPGVPGEGLLQSYPLGTIGLPATASLLQLEAEAVDTSGNSSSIVIQVDVRENQPPVVQILDPAPNVLIEEGELILVTVTATDESEILALRAYPADGLSWCADCGFAEVSDESTALSALNQGLAAQIRVLVPRSDHDSSQGPGAGQVVVEVEDDAGLVGTAVLSVSIANDLEPPVHNVSLPADGAAFEAGSTVAVQATAKDNVRVHDVTLRAFVGDSVVPTVTAIFEEQSAEYPEVRKDNPTSFGEILVERNFVGTYANELKLASSWAGQSVRLETVAKDRAGNESLIDSRTIHVLGDDIPPEIALLRGPALPPKVVYEGSEYPLTVVTTDNLSVRNVDLTYEFVAVSSDGRPVGEFPGTRARLLHACASGLSSFTDVLSPTCEGIFSRSYKAELPGGKLEIPLLSEIHSEFTGSGIDFETHTIELWLYVEAEDIAGNKGSLTKIHRYRIVSDPSAVISLLAPRPPPLPSESDTLPISQEWFSATAEVADNFDGFSVVFYGGDGAVLTTSDSGVIVGGEEPYFVLQGLEPVGVSFYAGQAIEEAGRLIFSEGSRIDFLPQSFDAVQIDIHDGPLHLSSASYIWVSVDLPETLAPGDWELSVATVDGAGKPIGGHSSFPPAQVVTGQTLTYGPLGVRPNARYFPVLAQRYTGEEHPLAATEFLTEGWDSGQTLSVSVGAHRVSFATVLFDADAKSAFPVALETPVTVEGDFDWWQQPMFEAFLAARVWDGVGRGSLDFQNFEVLPDVTAPVIASFDMAVGERYPRVAGGRPVPIYAEAWDDARLERLELYLNDNLYETRTIARGPDHGVAIEEFALSLPSDLADTVAVIRFRAYDTAGNVEQSESIEFFVEADQHPAVEIVEIATPERRFRRDANPAFFESGRLEVIEGNEIDFVMEVFDDVGISALRVLIDGEVVSEEEWSPNPLWSSDPLLRTVTYQIPSGTGDILIWEVELEDTAGQTTRQSLMLVPLVNQTPLVMMLAPLSSSEIVEGLNNVVLAAAAIDDQRVQYLQFYVDGQPVGRQLRIGDKDLRPRKPRLTGLYDESGRPIPEASEYPALANILAGLPNGYDPAEIWIYEYAVSLPVDLFSVGRVFSVGARVEDISGVQAEARSSDIRIVGDQSPPFARIFRPSHLLSVTEGDSLQVRFRGLDNAQVAGIDVLAHYFDLGPDGSGVPSVLDFDVSQDLVAQFNNPPAEDAVRTTTALKETPVYQFELPVQTLSAAFGLTREQAVAAPHLQYALGLRFDVRDASGNRSTLSEVYLQPPGSEDSPSVGALAEEFVLVRLEPDQPPIVEITSIEPSYDPGSGFLVTAEGAQLSVAVDAVDDIRLDRVELEHEIAGVFEPILPLRHFDEEAPYGFSYVLPVLADGETTRTVRLRARAIDRSGNVTYSIPVEMRVQPDSPPVVRLVRPEAGSTSPENFPLRIEAGALDDAGIAQVAFWIDESGVGDAFEPISVSTAPPYLAVYEPAFGIAPRTALIKAEAVDSAGQTSVAGPLAIEIVKDTSPPTVEVASPAAGSQVIEGTNYTIRAFAQDDAEIAFVKAFVAGELVTSFTAPPYEFVAIAPMLAVDEVSRSLFIEIEATDTAGNSASEILGFTVVRNQAPQCESVTAYAQRAGSIDIGSPNQLTEGATALLQAVVTDPDNGEMAGVSHVEIYIDSALETMDYTLPYDGVLDVRLEILSNVVDQGF